MSESTFWAALLSHDRWHALLKKASEQGNNRLPNETVKNHGRYFVASAAANVASRGAPFLDVEGCCVRPALESWTAVTSASDQDSSKARARLASYECLCGLLAGLLTTVNSPLIPLNDSTEWKFAAQNAAASGSRTPLPPLEAKAVHVWVSPSTPIETVSEAVGETSAGWFLSQLGLLCGLADHPEILNDVERIVLLAVRDQFHALTLGVSCNLINFLLPWLLKRRLGEKVREKVHEKMRSSSSLGTIFLLLLQHLPPSTFTESAHDTHLIHHFCAMVTEFSSSILEYFLGDHTAVCQAVGSDCTSDPCADAEVVASLVSRMCSWRRIHGLAGPTSICTASADPLNPAALTARQSAHQALDKLWGWRDGATTEVPSLCGRPELPVPIVCGLLGGWAFVSLLIELSKLEDSSQIIAWLTEPAESALQSLTSGLLNNLDESALFGAGQQAASGDTWPFWRVLYARLRSCLPQKPRDIASSIAASLGISGAGALVEKPAPSPTIDSTAAVTRLGHFLSIQPDPHLRLLTVETPIALALGHLGETPEETIAKRRFCWMWCPESGAPPSVSFIFRIPDLLFALESEVQFAGRLSPRNVGIAAGAAPPADTERTTVDFAQLCASDGASSPEALQPPAWPAEALWVHLVTLAETSAPWLVAPILAQVRFAMIAPPVFRYFAVATRVVSRRMEGQKAREGEGRQKQEQKEGHMGDAGESTTAVIPSEETPPPPQRSNSQTLTDVLDGVRTCCEDEDDHEIIFSSDIPLDEKDDDKHDEDEDRQVACKLENQQRECEAAPGQQKQPDDEKEEVLPTICISGDESPNHVEALREGLQDCDQLPEWAVSYVHRATQAALKNGGAAVSAAGGTPLLFHWLSLLVPALPSEYAGTAGPGESGGKVVELRALPVPAFLTVHLQFLSHFLREWHARFGEVILISLTLCFFEASVTELRNQDCIPDLNDKGRALLLTAMSRICSGTAAESTVDVDPDQVRAGQYYRNCCHQTIVGRLLALAGIEPQFLYASCLAPLGDSLVPARGALWIGSTSIRRKLFFAPAALDVCEHMRLREPPFARGPAAAVIGPHLLAVLCSAFTLLISRLPTLVKS